MTAESITADTAADVATATAEPGDDRGRADIDRTHDLHGDGHGHGRDRMPDRPRTSRPRRTVPRSRPVVADRAPDRGPGGSSGAGTAAEVARLMAAHPDWTTRDIAAHLRVSERTARRHVAAHRARTSRRDSAA
jgi:HTH domain